MKLTMGRIIEWQKRYRQVGGRPSPKFFDALCTLGLIGLESKWIPIVERLPEAGVMVEVSDGIEIITDCRMESLGIWYWRRGPLAKPYTHWRPIGPLPPPSTQVTL